MAPIGDIQPQVGEELWPAVAIQPRRLSESRDDIDGRDGPRRGLQRCQILEHLASQLYEKFVLQRLRLVLRAEDLVLHLLEFRGDEALSVGHGLLAVPGRRYRGEVRLGHLDE